MTQCVIAFKADASKVCKFVSTACVKWNDVINLCAWLTIADGAGWLFS
jgi:hypothetical protein